MSWRPDGYERQRQHEAQLVEDRSPGWTVVYGWYSRLFWAFGASDGQPIAARSASELLGLMRAAERNRPDPPQERSPWRRT